MKYIDTLIPDIYSLLKEKGDWFNEELAKAYADDVAARLQGQLSGSTKNTLRLSQMGPRCPKALWHSIHTPEEAESIPPWAVIKYSYGHMIEALAIVLAKAAGHTVTGEQDAVTLDGVVGHRDCVIDGCVVDVKSASSRAFVKFKNGAIRQDDPFGYLDQLDGYVVGSKLDPLVLIKDKGYLLVIDKQLGHVCLYEHIVREHQIRERINKYREIVALPTPPDCECGTRVSGKSGNVGLDTKASYSPYKFSCFPKLRTFLYSDGPVYLTKVVRKPDVPEIDRYGKVVYN